MSGVFRKRDLAVLVLVAVSIYLSYFDSPSLSYVIEPAWFIDQRAVSDRTGQTLDPRMVPPLVTDLEGDLVNEVILITSDFKLKVG
jgi:hypothetical protein